MATPGFTGVTVRLVLRLGLFLFCVFFACVCCVRLARQGHGKSSTQRDDELYIESAPVPIKICTVS